MKIYKLACNSQRCFPIVDEKSFLNTLPAARKPWINEESGQRRYFAVCPCCGNPIILAAFTNRKADSPRPYGRHYMGDVAGLAQYNAAAYLKCIYANHKIFGDHKRRRDKLDPDSLQILNLVKTQSDRLFEILEQDCGIHFSINLIGKMLKSYYAASGYTYMSSFPNNLPWSFADIIAEMSLYGCLINPYQGLGPDLLKKLGQYSYIKLEPFGKYVQVLTNRFTDISFTFRNLRIDEDDVQHIDFVVSRQRSNDLLDVERVFGKSFTINELRFQDLLNTPRTLKEQTRASQCQKLTEEIFGP